MKKKSFLIIPPPDDRIRLRNIFRIKGLKEIKDFMVQLEVEPEPAQWKAVVRYDLAHGYFHRDLICKNGSKKKHKIQSQDLSNATIGAIEDLKQNLERYLKIAGFVDVAEKLPPTGGVEKDLEEAKQFLLHLVEHPEEIDNVPNKVHQKLRETIFLKDSVTVIKKDSTGKIIEVR